MQIKFTDVPKASSKSTLLVGTTLGGVFENPYSLRRIS